MQTPVSLVVAASLALGGCATVGPDAFATWQVDAPAAAGQGAIDFHGMPVHTGQVLVSEQGTPNSVFLSLLVAENRPFVHSAVVVVEDGRPVVYESNGRLQPSLTGRPLTENVAGGVRRLDLDTFLRSNRYVALYEPPPATDRAKVAAFARDSLLRGVRFDPWFDGSDASRLYCSEFVALALAAGGLGPPATLPMTANTSVRVVLDWLAISSPAIIPPAELVAGWQRVGLFSRRDGPGQVAAWFAVKAELHRRFTPDQKLGNVVGFTPFRGLAFRPEVAGFIGAAADAARGWERLPAGELTDRVRALADRYLGPFEPAPLAPGVAPATTRTPGSDST